MSTSVLTCDCGARIKLPEKEIGRSVDCPGCGAALATASGGGRLEVAVLSQAADSGLCPICQTEMAVGEECVACPDCDQSHHRECWAEIGGCSTYGCAQAPPTEKSETDVSAPLTAWGDTKECPACGETIKSIALKCRYCSTRFETQDPMTLSDLKSSMRRADELKQTRQSAIALFVVSVIGCAAPLMLVIGGVWVQSNKEKVDRLDPPIRILAYTAVGLSAFYTLLIGLFWLFGEN